MGKIMLNGVDYSASGGGSSNEAYNRANAAYNQANTAYSRANTSYNRANTAYNQANSAYNRANEAYNLASSSSSSTSCDLAKNAMDRITANNCNLYLGKNVIAYGSYSIAIGTNSHTNGTCSIAIGTNSHTNGTYSIALGAYSDITSSYSIAIGHYSQSHNDCLAIGVQSNASGNYSTAIGHGAKSVSYESISIGHLANVNGNCSIGIGASCVVNNARNVIVIGDGASVNTNANVSVAIGSGAKCYMGGSIALGCATAKKDYSISIGYHSETNGNYSTSIGYQSYTGGIGSTALGYYAHTIGNNTIQLGNASMISTLSSKVSLTVTSDERDKADITEIKDGAVDFLRKIKAIRYVFNHRELYIDEENLSDEEREKKQKYGLCTYDKEAHALGTKKGNRIRVGVSAQNTQKALSEVYGDSGYANLINDNLFDYDPDEIPEGVESQLSANYEGFIPFLIKAIQELDTRLQILESANGGK